MAGIWQILEQNPVVLWGGLVLALIVYLITKHLENQEQQGLETPRPSSLDEIVKPKVREHVKARGKEPKSSTYFKIGRDVKGQVTKYAETKTPEKLLDPNPQKDSSGTDDDEELDDSDMVEVRIIMIKPAGIMDKLKQMLLALLGNVNAGGNDKFYIFRKDSFLNTPSDDMIVDPEVLSYNFAGMEVEISDPTRNVVNQAVQTEVSESVLAALPNYTEKVDFLFPLHSQEVKKIEQEGEHLRDDGEGF